MCLIEDFQPFSAIVAKDQVFPLAGHRLGRKLLVEILAVLQCVCQKSCRARCRRRLSDLLNQLLVLVAAVCVDVTERLVDPKRVFLQPAFLNSLKE